MGRILIANEHRARFEFSAEPTSVGAARRVVQCALEDWQLQHLSEIATLLVSELATNVVLHAGTSFLVEAEQGGETLRVSVFDLSSAGPNRREQSLQAGTGRGLALMDVLATSWGTSLDVRPWAKVVWFELPTDPAASSEPAEGALFESWSR